MTKASIAVIVGVYVIAAGCSTIVTGTTDVVRISSVPDGATVELNGKTYETPASVTLPRDRSYDVVIRKEGYQPAHRVISRVGSTASSGNLLVGGLVGVLTDQATGAAFRLFPTDLRVELVPENRGEKVYDGRDRTPHAQ